MPDWLWMIVLQVILIILNAVFAGSEIAVLSVNEYKVKKLADENNRQAKKLEKLISDPSRFFFCYSDCYYSFWIFRKRLCC